MKIYLSPNTAGRYGGALNGNLRHLNRFIQTELDNSEFKSSFDELWLTLSYPPMYVLPGVLDMEITFRKYYDTFPYSRLNRRYKKIDITLKAPEFSEHFDKEEQKKYKHKFEIPVLPGLSTRLSLHRNSYICGWAYATGHITTIEPAFLSPPPAMNGCTCFP